MKFKKIDNKTLCCMLTNEDLTDNDITLEDFIHNRDKVQAFLEDLIETAKDEVGFEANGPMLSIQIMAMQPDGVMITFSEEPKDMASAIRHGLEQVKGEMKEEGWVEVDAGGDIDIETDVDQNIEENDSEKMQTIFRFADMDTLLLFAENLPVWRGLASSLYKDEKSGAYLLLLVKGHISHENYRLVVATAMEFGELAGATDVKAAYLQEHCRTVIKEKAVLKLKKLVK